MICWLKKSSVLLVIVCLVGFLVGLSSSPLLAVVFPAIGMTLALILSQKSRGDVPVDQTDVGKGFVTFGNIKIADWEVMFALLAFVFGIYLGFIVRANSQLIDLRDNNQPAYDLSNYDGDISKVIFQIQLDKYLTKSGFSKEERSDVFVSDQWGDCLEDIFSDKNSSSGAALLGSAKILVNEIEQKCSSNCSSSDISELNSFKDHVSSTTFPICSETRWKLIEKLLMIPISIDDEDEPVVFGSK